jgi:SAM-dependent methyltransferase
MDRTPEPELMDEPAQAAAYAEADFEAPHSRFVELLLGRFPAEALGDHVLDLGCGPADITVRVARAVPTAQFDGVDGAAAMLDEGRARLEREPDALSDRIRLVHDRLPDATLPRAAYSAILSNSLLHHLHDPDVLWRSVTRYGAPGALVFVMDLRRPDSEDAVDRLVAEHAAGEPDVLRRDFRHSLHAAFTPDEVRDQLARHGLGAFSVEVVSDRHLIAYGRCPEQ